MNRHWAFWKRGWWAWLFVLCANVSMGLLVIPLAIAFRDNKSLYWVSALVLWFVVGAPLWGWIFERFASDSARVATNRAGEALPNPPA
ncbi:hypothetical protein [Tahibacter sp.]|uniref:hypothetical protein n=1 Tax=Tahibacter sp. TaxID=2056211 RepID=UPI0028C50A3F|nr:hypothetical protein [Tahibacter sp.]